MKLTKKQKSVVRRLIKVADEEGAGPKARKALIEAGLVESGLADLRHGDRDSEGVLQVRTGIHGADVARSVEESARRFLRRGFTGQGGAIELSRRLGSAGEVAQAVQGSAFPDRYAQRGGDADAILGGTGRRSGGQDTVSTRTTTTTPGVDNSALRQQMLQQYVLSRGKPDALLGLARGLSGAQDVAPTSETSTSSRRVRKSQNPVSSGTRPSDQLTELFHGETAIKRGRKIAPIPDHDDHVHAASGPKQIAAIKKLAIDMGLTITSEDEGYSGDGVHTPTSLHYKKRAIDVAGPPERMAAFTKRVARKYRVKL
jgi:hypothetical protein